MHPDEALRLEALHRLDILDTPRERDFDDVVDIVSKICGTPVSLITLVDENRQWFKAAVGTDIIETPRDVSFCAHTILQSDLLVVPDMLLDGRFSTNPLVAGQPSLRFYAGALLETEEGLPLGTLCVLDYQPRSLTDEQLRLLSVMARQVNARLALRRALRIEREVTASLANTLLEQRALLDQNEVLRREIDHRVKNSLQLIASFLAMQGRRANDAAVKRQLDEARSRVMAVATIHDQLHRTAQSDRIPVAAFLQGLCDNLANTRPMTVEALNVTADDIALPANQVMALGLAANELIANAFKHAYSDERRGTVEVEFGLSGATAKLTVCDQGVGLQKDFAGDAGAGLGMKVLSAAAAQLGGAIDYGKAGGGGCFSVSFPVTH